MRAAQEHHHSGLSSAVSNESTNLYPGGIHLGADDNGEVMLVRQGDNLVEIFAVSAGV